MSTQTKACLSVIVCLFSVLAADTADAQDTGWYHSYQPTGSAYTSYRAQPYQSQPQVYYSLVYDHSGQAWYVPVQQTRVSHPDYAVHSPSYSASHNHVAAAVMQDTRHNIANVADLVLTLHPGAWAAEQLGLINRDHLVQRIRGHSPHYHY